MATSSAGKFKKVLELVLYIGEPIYPPYHQSPHLFDPVTLEYSDFCLSKLLPLVVLFNLVDLILHIYALNH